MNYLSFNAMRQLKWNYSRCNDAWVSSAGFQARIRKTRVQNSWERMSTLNLYME